jgi:hypothetical protein
MVRLNITNFQIPILFCTWVYYGASWNDKPNAHTTYLLASCGGGILSPASPTRTVFACTNCDAGLIRGGRNQWRIVHYEAPVAFFHAVKQACKNVHCLRDPKISYRVQNNLPLCPVLCQMNIASNWLHIILKFVFNIILSYTQTNKLIPYFHAFWKKISKFIISGISNYVHPSQLPWLCPDNVAWAIIMRNSTQVMGKRTGHSI